MLYIVRHGESQINAQKIIRCKNRQSDLTDDGREQARKAGLWLKDKHITRMICSPFDRTRQTASLINESLQLAHPLIIDEDLSEFDCGTELEERQVTGDITQVFIAIFTRWHGGEWDARFENGESLQELYDRFSRVLYHYTSDENTLFITHAGISTAVIPHLLNNPQDLPIPPLVSNTGIIVLEPTKTPKYLCKLWNSTQHLEYT